QFLISGEPDTEVTYSINNGIEQNVIIDDTGNTTVSVTDMTEDVTINLVSITMLSSPFCTSTLAETATVEVVLDDASFFLTPGCDGATATVTGVTGGVFDFSEPPIDDAVIDPVTGEITGGTPEATYFVSYTTNGFCSNTSIEQVTLFPLPTIPSPITNYVQCDQTDPDANDGIEEFDLTTKDTEITGGNVDYAVSYYITYADADSAVNAIANPATYQNTTPFTETIYVRLENTVTDCYSVYDFDLIVNVLPVISNPAPEFHACEEVPGQADFVLHDHDQAVTNFQNGMTVRYFATQGAAEIGDPVDELPQVYVAPDSTIYARVEVTATGCWRVVSVPLVVEPAPISPALDALEECDFNLDDV